MKIISLHSVTPALSLDIHPDSTVVMSGRPLFLPEDSGEMVAEGHLAVRISRLGKNISVKFASRYYDAVTILLRILPASGIPEGMEGVYSALDASSVMGEWCDRDVVATPFEVTLDGDNYQMEALVSGIETAIHEVSRYMTLKIGDVLLLPVFGVTSPLSPSSHLHASIGASEVIDVKIV